MIYKRRRVSVLFNDSLHKLHLAQTHALVAKQMTPDGFEFFVDGPSIEVATYEKLKAMGLNSNDFDFVGVLVASCVPLEEGRVVFTKQAPEEDVSLSGPATN